MLGADWCVWSDVVTNPRRRYLDGPTVKRLVDDPAEGRLIPVPLQLGALGLQDGFRPPSTRSHVTRTRRHPTLNKGTLALRLPTA